MPVVHRPLGKQGLISAQQGLGMMGATAFYGSSGDPAQREAEAIAAVGRYLELCGGHHAMLDTAYMYFNATEHNETLVGKAIAKYGREKFVIATKCGVSLDWSLDGSPAAIRKQLSESLQRLGTDYVDLYYQHRQDPKTPIEQVAATFKELVNEGKIKYIGFSEITPDELRRAHAVHPVTAIQMEWSLQSRDIEESVVPVARELGVAIVAYSPLGRGLLSQSFRSLNDFAPDDWRRTNPRFRGDNLAKNAAAADKLAKVAARKGCTPGQLALAWVHSRGDDVFPIPGTKHAKRVEENLGALDVKLTPAEAAELEAIASEIQGDRYPAAMAGALFNARQQNV